jgi:hypothetical protein
MAQTVAVVVVGWFALGVVAVGVLNVAKWAVQRRC